MTDFPIPGKGAASDNVFYRLDANPIAQEVLCKAHPCSDSGTKSLSAEPSGLNPLPSLLQLERYITGHCKFLREYPGYKALLIELLWLIVDGNSHLLGAMDYIARQEAQESNAWLRDDYRIAWITCLFAARGYCDPQIAATYVVLGIHPLNVWPAIIARRQVLLGPNYVVDPVTGEAEPVLNTPAKKSPASVVETNPNEETA